MSNLDKQITDACHRIEDLYHETNGKCYVSFSGGKDSTVVLALIKMCYEIYSIPEMITAVFADTGIELDITYDFVKWCKSGWYQNIEIIKPSKPFSWVLDNKGKPMRSKMKSHALHQWHSGSVTPALISLVIDGKTLKSQQAYAKYRLADRDMHFVHPEFPIVASEMCCTYMKKKPFKEYEKSNHILGALTGVRDSEGGAREMQSHRREVLNGRLCTYTKNGIIYKMPIIDWSTSDVDEFIKKYDVPLSDAYTKYGFERTGCMACPFAKNVAKDLEYLYHYEPRKYKASMFWLKDVYIAQNVVLPFDEAYERERERTWQEIYEPMRQEMLRKYRPNSRLIKEDEQLKLII